MANVRSSAATLRIIGDDLIPDEITKLLKTSPTTAQIKGEKLIGKKTGTVRIAKSGMWRLMVPDREPEDLDGQIQEILSRMSNDLLVWKEIAKRFRIDLFCGLFMKDTNEGFILSSESLAALGERGIEIGFDIYAPTDGEHTSEI